MADDEKPAGEDAPPRKGDRLLKAIYWTVGVLALLVLLGALWVRHIDAEHQRILREAREAVETLRVEPVPDEDNAARLYEKAFNSFSMPPLDMCRKHVGRLDDFELDIGSDEIKKFLADNAAALDALAQAAGKPGCVFVTDYSAGIWIKGPSLLHVRTACLLLTVAARRAAHDGRHAEAAERISQALCLARGVGQVRTVIYHMSWASCEELSLVALRDTLVQTEPDGKALRTLHAILAEHSAKRPPVRDTLRGEHLTSMLTTAEVIAKPAWRLVPRGFTGLSLRDARNWEEMWDWAEGTLEKPTHEAFREWQRTDLAKLQERLGPPYSLLMPPDSMIRSEFADRGLLRCARLAVACRLHRLRAGALPAELKELAGYFPNDWAELSTDPFTGKLLGYRLTSDGFVIWSVGAWPQETAEALEKDPYGEGPPIFAVDPRLWEEHRLKTIELRERIKNAPKPRIPPARAKHRPPAAKPADSDRSSP